MSVVHVKTVIRAPIERVWQTIMDPDRYKDWVTIHRSVSDVSDKPLQRGSTMKQTMHMRGVTFNVQWTLFEVSAPKRASWEGRGPAHSRARILYELSTEGEGLTSFDYTNEFTTLGGRLGSVASRVIVGAASEREARNSLARLKALLEHG